MPMCYSRFEIRIVHVSIFIFCGWSIRPGVFGRGIGGFYSNGHTVETHIKFWALMAAFPRRFRRFNSNGRAVLLFAQSKKIGPVESTRVRGWMLGTLFWGKKGVTLP